MNKCRLYINRLHSKYNVYFHIINKISYCIYRWSCQNRTAKKNPVKIVMKNKLYKKRCHIETYHFELLTHSYLRISIAIYPKRLNNSVATEMLQVLNTVVKLDISCIYKVYWSVLSDKLKAPCSLTSRLTDRRIFWHIQAPWLELSPLCFSQRTARLCNPTLSFIQTLT